MSRIPQSHTLSRVEDDLGDSADFEPLKRGGDLEFQPRKKKKKKKRSRTRSNSNSSALVADQESEYIGVYWDVTGPFGAQLPWKAILEHGNRTVFCGRHASDIKAAQKINKKCAELGIPQQNDVELGSEHGSVISRDALYSSDEEIGLSNAGTKSTSIVGGDSGKKNEEKFNARIKSAYEMYDDSQIPSVAGFFLKLLSLVALLIAIASAIIAYLNDRDNDFTTARDWLYILAISTTACLLMNFFNAKVHYGHPAHLYAYIAISLIVSGLWMTYFWICIEFYIDKGNNPVFLTSMEHTNVGNFLPKTIFIETTIPISYFVTLGSVGIYRYTYDVNDYQIDQLINSTYSGTCDNTDNYRCVVGYTLALEEKHIAMDLCEMHILILFNTTHMNMTHGYKKGFPPGESISLTNLMGFESNFEYGNHQRHFQIVPEFHKVDFLNGTTVETITFQQPVAIDISRGATHFDYPDHIKEMSSAYGQNMMQGAYPKGTVFSFFPFCDTSTHEIGYSHSQEQVTFRYSDLATSMLASMSAIFGLYGIVFPNVLPQRYFVFHSVEEAAKDDDTTAE